ALELAARGHHVCLVDQDEIPVNRASLRNEGKIHLGLIYAHDASMATAHLQLRGAVRFRRLLHRWIGAAANHLRVSTPFTYLVAGDSLLSPDDLSEHFAKVELFHREQLAEDPDLDYLTTNPRSFCSPLTLDILARHFRTDRLQGGFLTAELAIDPEEIAQLLRRAIDIHPRIKFLASHRIKAIGRQGDSIQIEGDNARGPWQINAAQVVNATWESRKHLDSSIGHPVPPGWVHRLKYRMIVRLAERMRQSPSATMVLGRYGDVVVRPDGTAYLSWYPSGLQGWTHELMPPREWDGPCRGTVDLKMKRQLVSEFLQKIDSWFPGICESEPLLVDAGVITAYGRTDVDDPASGLHDRTRVGVSSTGNYHSIDPGKLTTAPLFAMEAADRVSAAL
ncbi:MAG: FAD-binding oxidoreductase, partial [Verrucomicrobiota bacterium]|nr:FAD-binding oxidoreductase [Verrucomicrobiota bacterium]